jgi:uncharacterized coiled-coil DUF342 family protein
VSAAADKLRREFAGYLQEREALNQVIREARAELRRLDPPHSCDDELRAAQRRSEVISNFRAKGGERWTCSCGKVYVHECDEAEGCSWVPG